MVSLEKFMTYLFSPAVVVVAGAFILVLGQGPSQLVNALVFLLAGGLPVVFIHWHEYNQSGNTNFDLSRMDRNDVFIGAVGSYAIVSILFGTQIFDSPKWMYLSMTMATYFGTFVVVNKYFDKASQHIGMFSL